jgi:hypothetical protein
MQYHDKALAVISPPEDCRRHRVVLCRLSVLKQILFQNRVVSPLRCKDATTILPRESLTLRLRSGVSDVVIHLID